MSLRVKKIMQESVNEQRPDKIFADAKEVEITRAIAKEFYDVLQDRAESDVIIIGAGPAGSNAAYECAKNGYSVIILEEDPVVGVPVQCGEGLSVFALQYLNIKPEDEFVARKISTLRVIFSNGNWMSVQNGSYELDREMSLIHN